MSEVEVSRCTGHCCKDFTLPVSPMQFAWWSKLIARGIMPWRMVHSKWRKWGGEIHNANCGYKTHYNVDEIKKISDMVIFLRADKTCNGNPGRKIDHVLYHYTCKHFDAKSGNCMNYENRPDMCRVYPNGGVCKYKGCTRVCEQKCSLPLRKEEDMIEAKQETV